jgi:hypothetical protein
VGDVGSDRGRRYPGVRGARLDADRADPHARVRALELAREHPPVGISSDEAAATVEDVLGSIGDTCPECPPDAG